MTYCENIMNVTHLLFGNIKRYESQDFGSKYYSFYF